MANIVLNNEWAKIPGDWDFDYYINKEGVVRYWWESTQVSKYDVTKPKFRFPKHTLYKVGYGAGYFACMLRKNRTSKIQYIHRLLALTFIPNPENKLQVNHIDGNSINNNIENLEWVTAKENIRHAWSIGLCTPHSIYGKTNEQPVKILFETRRQRVFELSDKGMSQRKIAEVIGIDPSVISRILNPKKIKTAI